LYITYASDSKARVIPVRFGEEELRAIDEAMAKTAARSRSEFIRDAVGHYLDTVKEMKVIRIRNVSRSQAKKEVLREKGEAETFDIANDLRLDLNLTIQTFKELWEERSIR